MFDIRKIQENIIYESVKAESNGDIATEVVYGKEGPENVEDDALWVKSAMNRLESNFESDTIKRIRMNCQCSYGMDEKLALVKELMTASSNIEEFTNSEKAKDAGLFCKDGKLFLQFNFCPCPMLENVKKLENSTWCQCTTGYSKVLFEKAFACKADVDLLKSIKMGDDICLMKITLHDPVWP